MINAIIYKIVNSINKIIYVGYTQTKLKLYTILKSYINNKESLLSNAMTEIGFDKFSIHVLDVNNNFNSKTELYKTKSDIIHFYIISNVELYNDSKYNKYLPILEQPKIRIKIDIIDFICKKNFNNDKNLALEFIDRINNIDSDYKKNLWQY